MTTRVSSSHHVPALDGVRGIAVLLVMLLHFSMMRPNNAFEYAFVQTLSLGWAGVDLFFVLSGFLITGILYDAKGGANYFRNFYLRRALRIFPLYYAFLILILVVLPRVAPGSMERLDGAPWLWTYTSNFYFATVGWEGMPEHSVHLWSLAVEEQFYLLWPVVVFFLDRTRLLRVAAGAMVIAVLFRLLMQSAPGVSIASYALLPARMDALALGGALALVVRGPSGLEGAAQLASRLLKASGILLAVAISWNLLSFPGNSWLPPLNYPTQIVGYVGTELASGALILWALCATRPGLLRTLSSRPLVALGKYSYGLYLIHVPIRDLIRSWLAQRPTGLPALAGSQLPAQVALYIVGIGVSVAIALVSWHFFEKHFLKLKALFPYGGTAGRKPMRKKLAAVQVPETES
ncbi:MAG: acyltransferase family protein [Longimicrobiales bacterium]